MIYWLLLATIFKQLMFSAVTPLWHGPDEQAHFAQVQYYAEFKSQFINDSKLNTTSQEVILAQQLLGTRRDALGKNLFTHNPAYRIDYTRTTIGQHEPLLRSLPVATRTNLIAKEATVYPPLYYIFGSVAYLLVYPLSLIDRVFTVRIISIIVTTLTVWFSFLIGEKLFPKSRLTSLTLATLISWQPMFSFLGSSVNSDTLMNLLFTVWFYVAVHLITGGKLTVNIAVAWIGVTLAGLFTKPHFVIVLFNLPLLLPIKWLLLMAPLAIATLTFKFKSPIGFSDVNTVSLWQPSHPITLVQHLLWTLRHTIAEVIPWYWGVFNWLGVTLPRMVNRVINRLTIVAAAGITIWLWRHRRIKQWSQEQTAAAFLGLSSIIFFAALMFWDWLFVRGHGFSFGMQGRYYFPTIVAHMAWLVIGLTSLIRQSWWTKTLGTAMIVLNFIGLYTLISAYYQLWPLNTLFNQISQYKPIYFKFPYLLIWPTLYLISLSIFIIKYLTYADRPRSRRQTHP